MKIGGIAVIIAIIVNIARKALLQSELNIIEFFSKNLISANQLDWASLIIPFAIVAFSCLYMDLGSINLGPGGRAIFNFAIVLIALYVQTVFLNTVNPSGFGQLFPELFVKGSLFLGVGISLFSTAISYFIVGIFENQ